MASVVFQIPWQYGPKETSSGLDFKLKIQEGD